MKLGITSWVRKHKKAAIAITGFVIAGIYEELHGPQLIIRSIKWLSALIWKHLRQVYSLPLWGLILVLASGPLALFVLAKIKKHRGPAYNRFTKGIYEGMAIEWRWSKDGKPNFIKSTCPVCDRELKFSMESSYFGTMSDTFVAKCEVHDWIAVFSRTYDIDSVSKILERIQNSIKGDYDSGDYRKRRKLFKNDLEKLKTEILKRNAEREKKEKQRQRKLSERRG